MISKFKHIFIYFLVIFTACIPRKPPAFLDANLKSIDYLKEQAVVFWDRRANPEYAVIAVIFLKHAQQFDPDDLDRAILLSRAYHFQGHYIEHDPVIQDSLFSEGARLAMDIIKRSPTYQQTYNTTSGDSISKILEAIAAVEKEYIGALYWWAANSGRRMLTKSVRERIAAREVMEAIMHRVLALNPDYFYGGPSRFFGAMYARLPGVELTQSAAYFQQALTAYPHYLSSYVLRASLLHTKSGDRELFRKDLEFVLAADPTLIPEVMPENLFEQKIAKKFLDQEDMLFE